jgi:hypothetical protein
MKKTGESDEANVTLVPSKAEGFMPNEPYSNRPPEVTNSHLFGKSFSTKLTPLNQGSIEVPVYNTLDETVYESMAC